MKSLFELRKEAQALGIADYAAMSKETLAKAIEEKSQQAPKVGDIEPEPLSPEDQAAVDAAEAEHAAEEKMSPVERLAARNAKIAKDKEEKAARSKNKEEEKKAAKAEAARLKAEAKIKAAAEKEAEKEAKKAALRAEKEAKKAEKAEKKEKPTVNKTPKAPAETLIFTAKGPKPEFRAGFSSVIYDELEKNDGRSYGVIARDLGTHYNMVRRIAEMYFEITSCETPTPEASTPVEVCGENATISEEVVMEETVSEDPVMEDKIEE